MYILIYETNEGKLEVYHDINGIKSFYSRYAAISKGQELGHRYIIYRQSLGHALRDRQLTQHGQVIEYLRS